MKQPLSCTIINTQPVLIHLYAHTFYFNFLFIIITIIIVLVGLGFELRGLCLQSRCSTAWVIPPVHFVLVILEIGDMDGLKLILLISAFQVARSRCEPLAPNHASVILKSISDSILTDPSTLQYRRLLKNSMWVALASLGSKWKIFQLSIRNNSNKALNHWAGCPGKQWVYH
jgi:hypothetical protein